MTTKIYKPKTWTKMLAICGFLFVLIIGGILFLIYNKEATLFQRIIIFIGIIFGIICIYVINNSEVMIDSEEIGVMLRIGSHLKGKSLLWNEIAELDSGYVLFPEGGYITLKPKSGVTKKPVHIPLDGMPIELVRDILSRLLPDAKVYLYTYLKRKLEGKQIWFFKDQKDEDKNQQESTKNPRIKTVSE